MLYETKVLLDRAVPLEQAGEWKKAIELCREAFCMSIRQRDAQSLIESVLRTAFSIRQSGDRELAAESFELALVLAQLHDDAGKIGRALNGLATLHHIHGELQQAEVVYRDALGYAKAVRDDLTCGNIEQNLGGLATIRGEQIEALHFYESAIGRYRRVGHARGTAGVLNNLGMLQIGIGDFASANANLTEALTVARGIGDIVTQGIVQLNIAELLIATKQLESARESCDDAFEIFSRLGEHANRADALRFFGIIDREAGRPYLAETHLREAIEVAAKHNYPLEEAEAQRELANVLRLQNRNKEALESLNRAHGLFSALQAKHKQADIDSRIDHLKRDFLSLVQAWGESIEAKDRYTSGHCRRVAEYACRIAEHAGIPSWEITWFRMGAFLHDVGKTEIPGEILNKPGSLTSEERGLIERHTIMGDEILSRIPFPWDIRPMVRSHHERWDGRGYPDQLAGERIPFTARILRVADVFDALTTTRSYRQPMSPEDALGMMEKDSGAFDPHLFEIFRTLLPEIGHLIPRRIQEGSEPPL